MLEVADGTIADRAAALRRAPTRAVVLPGMERSHCQGSPRIEDSWTFSVPVASHGYGRRANTRVTGRADVIAWLPVAVLTAGQIVLRLISLAAAVWQERVHARSNCAQMSTAAASDVMLCERRQDGTTLLITPRYPLHQDRDSAAGAIKRSFQGMPPP